MKEKYISRVSLEANSGTQRKAVWGLKNEEYIADFCLVSRRTLNDAEYRIFKSHFLLGADWKLCCRQLGMDRGSFFHEVYRIQQKLGRVFRELKPYALYPLDEYFNSTQRSNEPEIAAPFAVIGNREELPLTSRANVKILSFPVKRAA